VKNHLPSTTIITVIIMVDSNGIMIMDRSCIGVTLRFPWSFVVASVKWTRPNFVAVEHASRVLASTRKFKI
jgi:hypothetical protein